VTQVQTRPYQPTDAEAVAAMLNAIDLAVGRPAVITASLMADLVSGLVTDATTDSRVVLSDTGIVAAGFVTTPPEGGHRLDLIGGVEPKARGQGIGRSLLAWQVSRAEQIHAATAPDSPWEAHADVAKLDTSALALLARFGFTPARYAFDMVAETSGVADRSAPDGLTIIPYDAALVRQVHEAHMEAFTDHWGFQYRAFDAWLPLAVGSATFNPALSVVAMAGTEIAGYTLAYDDAIADQVYIGQVGVRRPWRRRGLAAAMLAHVLRLAAKAGRTAAALDVDTANPTGAVGVYEGVGFRIEHTLVTCARSLP
jgi:GNAT superfamily N-acetyltransferase